MKRILIALIIIALIIGLYGPVKNLVVSLQNSQVTPKVEETQPLPVAQALTTTNEDLLPTSYTPSAYVLPKYDPFYNPTREPTPFEEVVVPKQNPLDTPPTVDFTVQTSKLSFAEKNSGTVGTEFIFNAIVRDHETSMNKLQVRWNFESDDTPNTLFSRTKTARYTYMEAGTYDVTLEALDLGGNVVSVTKQVQVVNNTDPHGLFNYKPLEGTEETIFVFETSNSDDSQYLRHYLKFRFDWNGDGIWDTPYENKTTWQHKFIDPGQYKVIMEAVDPEGLSDTTWATITVLKNDPPHAEFTITKQVKKVANGTSETVYTFDASDSTDDYTASNNLRYRWDFNYTGSDDIVFDTQFSTSPKHTGTFSIPRQKVIRLQVIDQDLAMDETFQTINVER